jgi:hypothetical protein
MIEHPGARLFLLGLALVLAFLVYRYVRWVMRAWGRGWIGLDGRLAEPVHRPFGYWSGIVVWIVITVIPACTAAFLAWWAITGW